MCKDLLTQIFLIIIFGAVREHATRVAGEGHCPFSMQEAARIISVGKKHQVAVQVDGNVDAVVRSIYEACVDDRLNTFLGGGRIGRSEKSRKANDCHDAGPETMIGRKRVSHID